MSVSILRPLGALALTAALAVVLVAGLGACGFKLRAAAEVPPELSPVYVQAGAGSRAAAAMLETLDVSGVPVAGNPADGRLVIRILQESRSARVAAVDRNGKVIAQELHYRVRFDALGPGGRELLAPETLDLVRTFENPDVEVLGKQQEAELIYQDLTDEAAVRILTRLRAVLG